MENNTFNCLMSTEATANLSLEQRAFVETHKQIISCGTMAGRYFVELARKLKQMNDAKLYKAGGFETFADYVESAVGIKYRQARNYIKVAETYTDTYLEKHAGAGVTKLTLLAKVTAEVREEIENKIDLETASTSEINDTVQAAIRERDEAHKQLSLADAKLSQKETELSDSEKARESLQAKYDAEKKKLQDAQETERKLKAEIENLKRKREQSAPAKSDDDSALKEERDRADKLERKLREMSAQLAEVQAQKKTIVSNGILEFKMKFDDIQRVGEDLTKILRSLDEESAFKCRKALTALIAKLTEEWK